MNPNLKSARFNLEISRIFFFLFVFIYFLDFPFSGYAYAPDFLYRPVFYLDLLNLPLPSILWATILSYLFFVSVIFSILGLFTQISIATGLLIALYFCGLKFSFGSTGHYYHPILLGWMILLFARCGQSVSLDSRLRPRILTDESHFLFLLKLLPFVIFFISGTTKLRRMGYDFLNPQNFSTYFMVRQGMGTVGNWTGELIGFLANSPHLLIFGTGFVLMMELISLPLFLMFPKSRPYLITNFIVFHLVVLVLTRINFFSFVSLYLFSVDWSALADHPTWIRWKDSFKTIRA